MNMKSDLINILENKKGSIAFDVLYLIMIMIMLLLFVTYFSAKEIADYDWKTSDEIQIYSLKDSVSASGTIVLGSGTVDSEIHYYYVEKTEEGGFKQNSVRSSDTTIFYLKEGESPYIEILERESAIGYLNAIHNGKTPNNYNIYLPEGSVIENDYKVDSE